jgi:hypothetical protein
MRPLTANSGLTEAVRKAEAELDAVTTCTLTQLSLLVGDERVWDMLAPKPDACINAAISGRLRPPVPTS